jgi:hypothetical protein
MTTETANEAATLPPSKQSWKPSSIQPDRQPRLPHLQDNL